MDCLRLDLPLSGSTETDTCEDYSISIPKVKNEENLFLWFILFRSVCSILPIIIYDEANIHYIPDYFVIFQQPSLYATGCPEI